MLQIGRQWKIMEQLDYGNKPQDTHQDDYGIWL